MRAADPLSTLGIDVEVAMELLDELVALLDDDVVAWGGVFLRLSLYTHRGAPLPNLPTATRLGDDSGVAWVRERGGVGLLERLDGWGEAMSSGESGGWTGKVSASKDSDAYTLPAVAALTSAFLNFFGCGVNSSGVSGKLWTFLRCRSRLVLIGGVVSAL